MANTHQLMRMAAIACCLIGVSTPVLAQGAAAKVPTVVLPAELDRVLRDYEREWRARNATALAALFTEDGFVLSDRKPPVRGRANIITAYSGQGGPLTLAALGFATGDTVGYIVGTFGGTDPATHGGKFVLALRRAPGKPWQIAADIDNSSGH